MSRRPIRASAAKALALLMIVTLAGLAPAPAAAEPRAATPPSSEPSVTGRYLSRPPALPVRSRPSPARTAEDEPTRAPTRGTVTGRVLGPDGAALEGVLVQGVRFSDLGSGINYFDEEPVIAYTDAYGRFTLDQLTERYLIRFCDSAGEIQCPFDQRDARFITSYAGPDGVTDSWLRQTRFYSPKQPTRRLGPIRMRPYAQLSGTFAEGPYRSLRLLRPDGSLALRLGTDERGDFLAKVAPGRYRVEADRHDGLKTVDTVPGYRSRLLRLTAAEPTVLDVTTTPAAQVYGLVSAAGQPVADTFLEFIDSRGRFAAGVVTDADGRYRIESLKPGRYTIGTRAAFSPYRPIKRTVTLGRQQPTRADLELQPGGSVRFGVRDPGPDGAVDVELRTERGLVIKAWSGQPEFEPDGMVTFTGLPAGRYQLVVRRGVDFFSDEVQTEFPWAERYVTVTDDTTRDLGTLTLDRPTLNLTGNIPRNSQLKFTGVPYDEQLRDDAIEGPNVTPMTPNWTVQADRAGHYIARGVVPGRYVVSVTTQYVNNPDGSSSIRGNIAVTNHRVRIDPSNLSADFNAPTGGILTGRLRYAGTHRPLIAPLGYQVSDRGPRSWLFPTVSGPQTYGAGFRVDRLHPGRVRGQLLDLATLLDDAEGSATAIPDSLRDSALLEQSTPYWVEARPRHARVRSGQVTDLGWIDVRVRG